MIDPCNLPIGLRQLRPEYHHFTFKGYNVRITKSPNNWNNLGWYNGEFSFEMWTEPNIFHGHILVNLIDKQIIAITREEEYGRFSLPELEFKKPILNELTEKAMDLYISLAEKQYEIYSRKNDENPSIANR